MRRQEDPLVKPANLANLAKMANWSKSMDLLLKQGKHLFDTSGAWTGQYLAIITSYSAIKPANQCAKRYIQFCGTQSVKER